MTMMILSFTQPCNSEHPVESGKPCDAIAHMRSEEIPKTFLHILFGVDGQTCDFAKSIIKETLTNNLDEFTNWLLSRNQIKNSKNMFNYIVKYYNHAFDIALVTMRESRKKLDVMRCISLMTRFMSAPK